ncbi:hypothetical protein [Dictyobacter kobayashii]|uniref:Uncharacterized protein n=1 Tax=Dictyobacter kobayashii TaxID=2014872 RepID=A0A402AY09_9CHLR|nr:hypothetical protein [Dictyobacter kobayashii]GCE23969.1 hypothetical protein KDK_77690 [Dictyobacter kobayashii]
METPHMHIRKLLIVLWLTLIFVSFPIGASVQAASISDRPPVPAFADKLRPLISAKQKQMRVPGRLFMWMCQAKERGRQLWVPII